MSLGSGVVRRMKDWILKCFDEDARAIEMLLDVMRDVGDLWKATPGDRFGPSEQLIHLAQSGQFTCRFVREQLGIDKRNDLETFFQRAARNRAELARLNLLGARIALHEQRTLPVLRQWLVSQLGQIRDQVDGIDEARYGEIVVHPLVHFQDAAGEMLARMFARHWPYHLGQATEQIKNGGYARGLPFLPQFGAYPG